MAHIGDRLEPQPPTELPEVTPPVLLLLCHPRAAGYSPPYNEREPWHAMVAKELERMTKLQIVSLLKHYPEFAGYIVAVYGQDRWLENARDLRDATETENWHRDRDLEVRLVHQRDLRWYHFNILRDIPCDLRRTRRQQFLQLELELAIMKYRDLRQTLQCVQGNQFLYHPWALVPAANLNPLQAQYLAWREYIVQDLTRRLSIARLNVLRWTVRLAGHPRPWAALSPILLQGPQVHGVINSANCLGFPRLIDLLVRYDCQDALMMLRRIGVFHPVSFHRRGWTLLHDALIWNAPRVSRWFLNEYTPDHLWRVPYGTPALQHIALPWTDLEFMLYMGWRRWFLQAWERVRDAARNNLARGADIFQPHTCEILCTFVPTDFAEDLEAAPFNLDIAITNVAAPNPHVPLAFQNQAGTTWHRALRNPDIHFLDFMGRRNARQIDIADANGDTPLQLALAANDRIRVRRLIQWGANTRQTAIPVIQSLPLLTDPEWNFYFHAIGSDLAQGEGTNEGTWLHETVRGLDTQLTRNDNNRRVSKKKRDSERAKLGTRAENMIRKIRRGNDFSQGNIAVTDAQGRTAWRIANERGLFPRIQRALQ